MRQYTKTTDQWLQSLLVVYLVKLRLTSLYTCTSLVASKLTLTSLECFCCSWEADSSNSSLSFSISAFSLQTMQWQNYHQSILGTTVCNHFHPSFPRRLESLTISLKSSQKIFLGSSLLLLNCFKTTRMVRPGIKPTTTCILVQS